MAAGGRHEGGPYPQCCNGGTMGPGGTKTMSRERTRLWLWFGLREDNGLTMELTMDYEVDYGQEARLY